jgi:hypothetical protein
MRSRHLKAIESESDRGLICREAAARAAKLGPITAESIERSLEACVLEYKALPDREVLLITTMSVRRPPELSERLVRGWKIQYLDSPPHRIESFHPTDVIPEEIITFRERGPWIFARGRARTGAEAGMLAMDSIDILRGAWNLGINSHLFAQWLLNPSRPMNAIRLGPLHTLHHPDGNLIYPSHWWFDPAPFAPSSLGMETANWEHAFEGERLVEPALNSGVGPLVRSSLIRYARALDNSDPEMAFVRLSAVLERLTMSYKEAAILRRVKCIFTDPELDLARFRMVRDERHESAHLAEESFRRRASLLVLHRFVVRMFDVVLRNHGKFRTVRDFARFLEGQQTGAQHRPGHWPKLNVTPLG